MNDDLNQLAAENGFVPESEVEERVNQAVSKLQTEMQGQRLLDEMHTQGISKEEYATVLQNVDPDGLDIETQVKEAAIKAGVKEPERPKIDNLEASLHTHFKQSEPPATREGLFERLKERQAQEAARIEENKAIFAHKQEVIRKNTLRAMEEGTGIRG